MFSGNKSSITQYVFEEAGESFIDDYVEVGRRLKLAGATKLCMCCNTAHYAIEELQEKIGLPFINLIDCVANKIIEKQYKSIGLIASDGCLMGKVYEKIFASKNIYIYIEYPSAEIQKQVTKGICNVKNKIRFDNIQQAEHPYTIFSNIDKQFQSVDCIVWGCTNIKLYHFRIVIHINSLEVLAEEIIKESIGNE